MGGSIGLRGCVGVGVLLAVLGCGGPEEESGNAQSVDSSAPGAAASGNGDGQPQRGDWLVLELRSDPENLNPITSSDASATQVLNWLFPPLLTLDNETLELRPVIATALPEVSEDKLTYTFRLRDDVTFADGKPLTAEDVVFTMKISKHPQVRAPHLRNYYESVRDVVAVDPHTVRFDLRQPYFRNDWTLGATQPMPRHYYDPEGLLEGISVADLDALDKLDPARAERAKRFADQFNEGFQRRAMGAGAFEIKNPETDVVTGEKIVLTHRDPYWGAGDPKLGDAFVNRIVYRIINDAEAALVSFKGGTVDSLDLTPVQHTRADTNSDKFLKEARKKEHIVSSYTYVGWNLTRPLFQDVRVRRALGHFADRESLIKNVLFGLGQTIESPVYGRRPEYKSDLPPYPFDPALGKKLLAEAGWTDSDGDGVLDKMVDGKRVPLRFEIISNAGNDTRRSVGLALIDQMKRAGIDASFRDLDWSIMLDRVKKFDFDAVILGWQIPLSPPDLYQVWHSSQAVPGGSNHIAYKNPELDKLLEQYRVEFDPAKRKELYDRAQQIIYDDQPYTFLYMPTVVTAWDTRFRGVAWYPSGSTDLNEWWVPVNEQQYVQ
jgi:peptide/nickel transport system substrate-binding protein